MGQIPLNKDQPRYKKNLKKSDIAKKEWLHDVTLNNISYIEFVVKAL